jgi:hypothetical protein
MSEQRDDKTSTPEDEAREAGATAQGTVNPADLAAMDVPDDDVVDH